VGDGNVQPVRFASVDDAPDSAIVEPDAIAGTDVLEDLFRRAADLRGCEDTSPIITNGAAADHIRAGHD
jgi:hypothetical protein